MLIVFLLIIVTTLAKLWKKSKGHQPPEMNVFNIPDQKQSSSFQLQYDKIQRQLECIAGMDNLLSGTQA